MLTAKGGCFIDRRYCYKGKRCINSDGSSYCLCSSGWVGTHCDTQGKYMYSQLIYSISRNYILFKTFIISYKCIAHPFLLRKLLCKFPKRQRCPATVIPVRTEARALTRHPIPTRVPAHQAGWVRTAQVK